jgi:hypothetical protein
MKAESFTIRGMIRGFSVQSGFLGREVMQCGFRLLPLFGELPPKLLMGELFFEYGQFRAVVVNGLVPCGDFFFVEELVLLQRDSSWASLPRSV